MKGKLGGGGGWERQREITAQEISILVAKGINKDSENLAQSKELRV